MISVDSFVFGEVIFGRLVEKFNLNAGSIDHVFEVCLNDVGIIFFIDKVLVLDEGLFIRIFFDSFQKIFQQIIFLFLQVLNRG